MRRAFALVLLLVSPALAAAPESLRFEADAAFSAVFPAARPAPRPRPAPAAPQPPRVCTPLDFGGVVWPARLTLDDRRAVELALSISGSFEGQDAWANITDDFDGQGLSLGLLNQCLGQGSLQPLLIRLRDERPEVLARVLGADRRRSLLEMLARWQSSSRGAAPSERLSLLDEPRDTGDPLTQADRDSVSWARANLYRGGAFVPEWKAELQTLAATPEYVTLQVGAALSLHDRALADESFAGVRELRAYLMLFDVQVQNGGLYAEDRADYAAWRRAHQGADATASLKKLLELRLRRVRAKYRADVRSRKTAIVDGTGRVHGERRDLPAQYCYDGLWPYR